MNVKNSVFQERFRELCDEYGSYNAMAKVTGLSRQTIGFFYNGVRLPNFENLSTICKTCNVSSDFLLGLSQTTTNNNINFQKSCNNIKDSITTEVEQFLIVDGLREFMHGWCMDAEETNKCKEPVFRCRICPFEDGEFCRIKWLVKDLFGNEAAYLVSAMSR